jgi:hypothetical protein
LKRELRGLRASQRAMIAARATSCERSDAHKFREHLRAGTCEGITGTLISVLQAAEVAQVSNSRNKGGNVSA